MLRLLALLVYVSLPVGVLMILGGWKATVGQFPYLVSLRRQIIAYNTKHFCGGTIISERIIVTAAHCCKGKKPRDIIVHAGSNYINTGGQQYEVSTFTIHPKYSKMTTEADIALLKTWHAIQFSPLVYSIPLQTSEIPPGALMEISGWGLTSVSFPNIFNKPNSLQWLTVKNIDLTTCAKSHASSPDTNVMTIFPTNLCTYMQEGTGICFEDSGGPLVYNGLLAGVASWVDPCGKGYPDVFTRVSAYIHWIRSTSARMI